MKFNKKIKNLFFEYVQLKKKLIETENEFEWSGNYLGDYGEYIAITKYNLEKSPKGTNGFDAINPLNGDKVQIKTVQKGTKSIHFNKNTDVLFVLVVSDDASWEVIYDGKLDKIFKKFGVRKKYTLALTTLIKLNKGIYNRVREYKVKLKNGKTVCATNRRDMRKKLLKLGINCVSESAINQRFNRDKKHWKDDLERIFGVKVHPKYAPFEKYIDEEGYTFYPVIPNKELDANPLKYTHKKLIYLSQREFSKHHKIPDDFVSLKIKEGFSLLEIIGLYKEIADKRSK